jgi:hypothetical protein
MPSYPTNQPRNGAAKLTPLEFFVNHNEEASSVPKLVADGYLTQGHGEALLEALKAADQYAQDRLDIFKEFMMNLDE